MSFSTKTIAAPPAWERYPAAGQFGYLINSGKSTLNNAIVRKRIASKSTRIGKSNMSHVIYQIVEREVDDVFSETFPSRESAHKAANRAAREQRTPGDDEAIEYEDSDGKWHDERAKGVDRPDTDVKG
jgi:hypothetical protein